MTPAAALAAALAVDPPRALGVAISGGGDSMALLHLLSDWAQGAGVTLAAATVDHGLRPEAAAEAALAARACAALGIPHAVLEWRGWDGQGNLADAARRARHALLADWAMGRGIGAIALAHTLDDQAETVLMRLARGSGVDGLSGMAPRRQALGVIWLRPLLAVRRAALRGVLTARGIGWAEDPTNDDPAYDRVKARRALATLAPLGLDAEGLVATAARMAVARRALEETAHALALRAARVEAGDVVLDRAALMAAPEETRLRLIAHALRWVASADYRPRLAALTAALGEVLAGRRRTLAGCLVAANGSRLRITREHRAISGLTGPTDAPWDHRWRLIGPHSKELAVRALGEAGLAACPNRRATGLPRATLLASPGIWRGDVLIAAPLAGHPAGWRAELVRDGDDFMRMILSH